MRAPICVGVSLRALLGLRRRPRRVVRALISAGVSPPSPQEFLFAPYSVFAVARVEWSALLSPPEVHLHLRRSFSSRPTRSSPSPASSGRRSQSPTTSSPTASGSPLPSTTSSSPRTCPSPRGTRPTRPGSHSRSSSSKPSDLFCQQPVIIYGCNGQSHACKHSCHLSQTAYSTDDFITTQNPVEALEQHNIPSLAPAGGVQLQQTSRLILVETPQSFSTALGSCVWCQRGRGCG